MTFYSMNTRCINCDALNTDAPHGASFENSFNKRRFCSSCGSDSGWYDSKEKWVDTSKMCNPFSWFSGYWEKVE